MSGSGDESVKAQLNSDDIAERIFIEEKKEKVNRIKNENAQSDTIYTDEDEINFATGHCGAHGMSKKVASPTEVVLLGITPAGTSTSAGTNHPLPGRELLETVRLKKVVQKKLARPGTNALVGRNPVDNFVQMLGQCRATVDQGDDQSAQRDTTENFSNGTPSTSGFSNAENSSQQASEMLRSSPTAGSTFKMRGANSYAGANAQFGDMHDADLESSLNRPDTSSGINSPGTSTSADTNGYNWLKKVVQKKLARPGTNALVSDPQDEVSSSKHPKRRPTFLQDQGDDQSSQRDTTKNFSNGTPSTSGFSNAENSSQQASEMLRSSPTTGSTFKMRGANRTRKARKQPYKKPSALKWTLENKSKLVRDEISSSKHPKKETTSQQDQNNCNFPFPPDNNTAANTPSEDMLISDTSSEGSQMSTEDSLTQEIPEESTFADSLEPMEVDQTPLTGIGAVDTGQPSSEELTDLQIVEGVEDIDVPQHICY